VSSSDVFDDGTSAGTGFATSAGCTSVNTLGVNVHVLVKGDVVDIYDEVLRDSVNAGISAQALGNASVGVGDNAGIEAILNHVAHDGERSHLRHHTVRTVTVDKS
jgi:hypothetical protein